MNWTLTTNKDFPHLAEAYPWVADMHGVPQDPRHHAEGDVATHTRMVLEALTALPGYAALNAMNRELLWAAALLHDVEKRSTTVTEPDGSITSRGHARKGEFTARQLLYRDIPTPFVLREHIAALVRYHGLPLWITEKPDARRAVLEASLRVDTRLLSLLARADVLGRHCADRQELLERIDFFDAYCEEQQCWGTPYAFASGHGRYHYFQKDDAAPDYEPFDDLKGDVVMLSGLPGMGKNRYLNAHYSGWPTVSLDDIRRAHKLRPDDASATGWVVQQAKEQARVYLRQGQSFVWNATNTTRQMRAQWIDLFAAYKARVTVVYIEVPYDEWLQQNRNREYVVSEAVLMRMLAKLEVPLLQEAHTVQYAVR